MDPIRAGIQQHLDACGDGWSLSHYVVAMSLERITSDGEIETMDWWTAPVGQPPCIRNGLADYLIDTRYQTEAAD